MVCWLPTKWPIFDLQLVWFLGPSGVTGFYRRGARQTFPNRCQRSPSRLTLSWGECTSSGPSEIPQPPPAPTPMQISVAKPILMERSGRVPLPTGAKGQVAHHSSPVRSYPQNATEWRRQICL